MYYNGKPWYSALTNITEINEARIRETKIELEAKLERGHRAQCQTVPDQISHEHHGIHLYLCYKRFTRILAIHKKEELSQQRSSVRLSTGSSIISETASLFEDKCYLCKKGRVQYKNKEYFQIENDEAVETLLAAAKTKNLKCIENFNNWTYKQKNLTVTNIVIITSHVDLRKAVEKILGMKKM